MVGGVGLIRQRRKLSVEGVLNDITDNDFGYDVGGGLQVSVGSRVGVRGEVRFFHVQKSEGLDFGRAFIGIVLGS